MLSCSTDNKANLYSLKTLKPVHNFTPHQDLITSAKFCFSTKHIVTSSLDQTIKFWDINTCAISKVVNTYSQCFDCHVSRSETYIVSGHKDTSIRVWNAKTRDSIFKLEDAHGDPVACVRMTPNEN